ncbi:hypothetical protein CF327_g3813 [Tilletia walkeri]|nr:hypothetical protein CF327_g3813 [Tilletia walkeri]
MLDPIFHLQGASSSTALAPLFLIHPISGFALSYLALGPLTTTNRPIYGINARIITESDCKESYLPASVTELADEYICLIEASGLKNPSQPWLIGGWSYGGMVAFAMACKLQARGSQVLDCIMIDSIWPYLYPTLSDEFEKETLTDMVHLAIQQRVLPSPNHRNAEKIHTLLNRTAHDTEPQPDALMEILDLDQELYEGDEEWSYLPRKAGRSASCATTVSTSASSSGPATPNEESYMPILWSEDYTLAAPFVSQSPERKTRDMWAYKIDTNIVAHGTKGHADDEDDAEDEDDEGDEDEIVQLLLRVRMHIGHSLQLLSQARLMWTTPYSGRLSLLRCNIMGSASSKMRRERISYFQERLQHQTLGWNSNGEVPQLRVFHYQQPVTHDECFDQPFVLETTQLLATALRDLIQ